jgi:hypothetical protein
MASALGLTDARRMRQPKDRKAVDFTIPATRYFLVRISFICVSLSHRLSCFQSHAQTRPAQRDYRDLDAIEPNGFFNRDVRRSISFAMLLKY